METCTCFDSSRLFIPSLLCVEHRSMWRPLARTCQATWFPHISSLSFPCGQPCQQQLDGVGGALKLQKSPGLERRPEFPPSPGCAPAPFLPQSLCKLSEKCLSSYTEQSVLCLHGHSRHGPPPGTRPLHNWPLKPQRTGSPDTKHDPVMSYPERVRVYNPGERLVVCHHAV